MKKATLHFTFYAAAYAFYVLVGALVFSTLEIDEEMQALERYRTARTRFLAQHSCVSEAGLDWYMKEVVLAAERGVLAYRNSSHTPNWSLGGSIFFSVTLLATVGYGDMRPTSDFSRLFCVVYATFGVPATVILLDAAVERWRALADRTEHWILKSSNFNLSHRDARLMNAIIYVIIFVSSALLVPAALMAILEDWNYFDSVYACFITFSTIGLGDYVPGNSESWLQSSYRSSYKISMAFCLIIGLSLMLAVMDVSSRIPPPQVSSMLSLNGQARSSPVGKLEDH